MWCVKVLLSLPDSLGGFWLKSSSGSRGSVFRGSRVLRHAPLGVQTHLIPHNYTAGLKRRIDARVCSGAVEDFPECKGLIEVVCLRRIDLTTTNQYKGGHSASVAAPLLDGSACPVHSCSWKFLNYWKTQFFKLHPPEMRNTSPDEKCISAGSIIYSQVVEHLSKPLGFLFLTCALGVISGRLNFQFQPPDV